MPLQRITTGIAFLLVVIAASATLADGLTLTNNLTLEGEPIKRSAITLEQVRKGQNGAVYPLMTVEDGVRRYFFPFRLADRSTINNDAEIGLETFEFDHRNPPTTSEPDAVGLIDQTVGFASDATRTLDVSTPRGPKTVVQGATFLTPDYVEVTSLNLAWNYGLLTSELSDESLISLLGKAADPTSLQDALTRVRFLTQAEKYELARAEMTQLKDRFPQAAARAESFDKNLLQLYGQKILRELKQMRAAGQHKAVYRLATTLRDADFVSADTSDDAADILDEYDDLLANRDEIIFQLGDLEGQLEAEDAELVRPLRSRLEGELHADTIDRLKSFLANVDDETMKPSEKLSLAYSAWVAGPQNATSDLLDAVDFWTLRDAILDYVAAENKYIRDDRYAAIDVIEGVDIRDLEAMIPLLPPTSPAFDVTPNEVGTRTTADGVEYKVLLPPEYSVNRTYPVLIALHAAGLSPDIELRWWGGTPEKRDLAGKRGYIVVAPDYLGDDTRPSGHTHDRITDVLIDVRKRFNVDSDRVFLVGHGEGADVVLDVGFARPMPWAGLVPINGTCSQAVRVAWENGLYVPTYAVGGGLDKASFVANASTFQRIMEKRHNFMFCEYMNRGREPFGVEKPRIFEWLNLHRRGPIAQKIEARIFHPTDTDWGWYRATAKPGLTQPRPGERPVGHKIDGNITLGNKIYLASQPATLMLSPALVDFETRVQFRYGTRRLKTRILEPSMKTMLDDYADRADRERLFWTKVTVP